ncbi:MAG: leucine-rich repeat domain-containing protein [Bacteroidales bacterium]|nr:leucine-rich repeat domain-containing protein [Bacteroidales bacterium]
MNNTEQKPKEILELEEIYQIRIEEKKVGLTAKNTYTVNTKREITALDLSFNELTEIKGLESFTSLERLDLAYNQITEIKGLDNLIKLNYLNLTNNPLKINGLENLPHLKITNLSCRSERNIVNSLDGSKSLQEILDSL